ncbi:MAG: type II toxin-antitoxin system RelE/ParE family toxin [Hahellaceae bacterium]|nr:type II toxin-antitoxin system RelE/ParE family toxin [Hahellaceae bacterium]MCP5212254.1 type II toxin-antitoxin system RelE/ParE family toxin [Hahellaceae bacterium]
MAQIKWSEPAVEDLNEVAEYIVLDKPGAAKNLVQEVFKLVRRLKDFPESGKVHGELEDSRYREVIVGPCRVFYRVEGDIVFVLFVLFVLFVMRSERALRNFILEYRAKGS